MVCIQFKSCWSFDWKIVSEWTTYAEFRIVNGLLIRSWNNLAIICRRLRLNQAFKVDQHQIVLIKFTEATQGPHKIELWRVLCNFENHRTFYKNNFAMSDFSTWYKSVPQFTRYWLSATLGLSIAGKLGVLPATLFYLDNVLVFQKFQVSSANDHQVVRVNNSFFHFRYGDLLHRSCSIRPAFTSSWTAFSCTIIRCGSKKITTWAAPVTTYTYLSLTGPVVHLLALLARFRWAKFFTFTWKPQ